MQPDPVRVADTRAWLVKAAPDLRAGDTSLKLEPPLTADAVFHAQQLAEKSLKAFLTWHDQPFRKTHNLVEIGQACVTIDASLHSVLSRAGRLTEYAWKFRYPGDPDEPTLPEAEAALVLAHEAYEEILARLPAEVRP